jgi:hypothetical protein
MRLQDTEHVTWTSVRPFFHTSTHDVLGPGRNDSRREDGVGIRYSFQNLVFDIRVRGPALRLFQPKTIKLRSPTNLSESKNSSLHEVNMSLNKISISKISSSINWCISFIVFGFWSDYPFASSRISGDN